MENNKAWIDFRYRSQDGLMLAARQYGWQRNDAPVVVCLAGLTRNSADFDALAMALSEREKNPLRVVCFDYRGRGLSQYDSNFKNYDPLVETGDILAGLAAMDVHKADFVGTSRGGMILMALSAIRPGVLSRVVLNDIGPEIDGPGLVRIKNYIENARQPSDWNSARQMMRDTMSHAFTQWTDKEWDEQARLIFEEVDGALVPRYDPAMKRQLASINLDQPLPTFWPQFAGLKANPLLLIRGANSDLLSRETVEQMKEVHPSMQHVEIPDQGHAPFLGDERAIRIISGFLN